MSAQSPCSRLPDLAVEPQKSGVAAGRHVKQLDRGEPGAAQHRHLVGLRHGGEHGVAGAAADVGREPHGDRPRLLAQMRACQQAGAQEGVRGRAVDDLRACLVEACALAFRKMDAVGEEALRPQKPVTVVDVGVVLITRETGA